MICRDWPLGRNVQDIRRDINQLPGPPVTALMIARHAAVMHVKRPPGSIGVNTARRLDEPAVKPPASAPAPASGQASATSKDRPPSAPAAANAQAAPPVAPRVAWPPVPAALQPQTPTQADEATIRRWAGERGLCNGTDALDLGRINARRDALGLPPFQRTNGFALSAGVLAPRRT